MDLENLSRPKKAHLGSLSLRFATLLLRNSYETCNMRIPRSKSWVVRCALMCPPNCPIHVYCSWIIGYTLAASSTSTHCMKANESSFLPAALLLEAAINKSCPKHARSFSGAT